MFSDEAGADEGFDDFGDAFSMNETSLLEQERTGQEGPTERLYDRSHATAVTESGFDKAVNNLVSFLVLEGQYIPKATTANAQRQELDRTIDAIQYYSDNMAPSAIYGDSRGVVISSDQGMPVARAGNTYAKSVFPSAPVGNFKRSQIYHTYSE